LKLGRRSETGREQRVTPEFGERKEEKKSTPQIQGVTVIGDLLEIAYQISSLHNMYPSQSMTIVPSIFCILATFTKFFS
jgi:hypothetical protein